MQDGLRLGKRVLSARLAKFALVGGSCAVVQLSALDGQPAISMRRTLP